MIKRFLYGVTATFFLAFAFTSCEDTNGDNFKTDTDAGWVQFEDPNQADFVGGFHTMIEIPVDLHTNTNIAGLDVFYTITNISGDVSSVIVDDPGFVHFEPGQTTATTKIRVSSDIPDTGFLFSLTLSSASRENISILSNDLDPRIFQTKTVCLRPIILATNYVGEVYTLDLDSNGNFDLTTLEFASNITTALVPTAEDNVFTFDMNFGAWGTEFVPSQTGNSAHSVLRYQGQITINPDGTVVVDGNDTAVIGGVPTVYTSLGNRGTIDPCAQEITYTLQHELPIGDHSLARVVIRPQ